MTVEAASKIGAVREAIVQQGRKRFTARDVAALAELDPAEVNIMLATETRHGRLARLETGVYRAVAGAYDEVGSGHTNGNGSSRNGSNGDGSRPAVREQRPVKVEGESRSWRFVADTADGTLLADEVGQLWLARPAKITTL